MPLPRLGVIFSIKGVGRPVTSLPVGRLLTGARLIGPPRKGTTNPRPPVPTGLPSLLCQGPERVRSAVETAPASLGREQRL